ncbi:LysR family transcriptional regulator [Sphingosinicella sp. CPCC 101087]|uniref:LysR family transcriptional regulator n=1 Tax=Sphingosinicella sp. CPCC 101087 TaxID=2497754 RepID=UPI00101DE5AC|nr:LysR family transcriptional regulator [Sphingosinicella sp. CPCC 101087]
MPPLESLRVFEACARHGNFTKAASELGVTPTAVSLRIRDLEGDLGCRLFRRNGPRVALTEAGAAFAGRIGRALEALRAAVEDVRDQPVIRVTAAPTFAARWLAPRLASFRPAGGSQVRLSVATELEENGAFDVAIRSGAGPWPGLRSLASVPVEGAPMLSAGLAAGERLQAPEDLLRLPLLPDERWPDWFACAGVDHASARYASVQYPTQELAAAAALDGAGVALLSPALFGPLVSQGRLAMPFEQVVRGPGAHHLLVAEDPPAAVREFCDWVVTELVRCGAVRDGGGAASRA